MREACTASSAALPDADATDPRNDRAPAVRGRQGLESERGSRGRGALLQFAAFAEPQVGFTQNECSAVGSMPVGTLSPKYADAAR